MNSSFFLFFLPLSFILFTTMPIWNDNNKCNQTQHLFDIPIVNNKLISMDNMELIIPDILPVGWKIAGRRRSIFELDTNIQTLGDLYSTLADLRKQLPTSIAEDLERPLFLGSHMMMQRQSTDDFAYSGFTNNDTPEVGHDDAACHWMDNYPHFIFDRMLSVYLECGSYPRISTTKIVESHHRGKLNKGLASAIYAYGALHSLLCHPNEFGIYPFLSQLASDAYQSAHNLVEFDLIEPTTVETLVVMHLYLLMLGHDREARNLFCLAVRHFEFLDSNLTDVSTIQHQRLHRLFLWMTELDWCYTARSNTSSTPLIQPERVQRSLSFVKYSDSMEEFYAIKASKFRIRGLSILISFSSGDLNTVQTHQQLNDWRSHYLKTFIYRRESNRPYGIQDRHALLLHAIYFSSMLQLHQVDMMQAYETTRGGEEWEEQQWTSYFNKPAKKSRVEKGLYACINAGYGLIEVMRLLMEESDYCLFPLWIDSLSAACTFLYFGNKVVFDNNNAIKKSREAILYVLDQLLNSTLIQSPKIDAFVKHWHRHFSD